MASDEPSLSPQCKVIVSDTLRGDLKNWKMKNGKLKDSATITFNKLFQSMKVLSAQALLKWATLMFPLCFFLRSIKCVQAGTFPIVQLVFMHLIQIIDSQLTLFSSILAQGRAVLFDLIITTHIWGKLREMSTSFFVILI